MPRGLRLPASSRALTLAVGALALSLLSCGREITGPGGPLRFAEGLSFIAEFPEPLRNVAAGAGSYVPYDRVRVVFRRTDGAVALDTLIAFGAGTDSVAISFRVPLGASAPASGEPLTLSLRYVNAAGDTVFSAGPTEVLARAVAAGQPPPAPVNMAVNYVGVGASATSVTIAPESLTVLAGSAFAFSGTAYDAQAAVLTGTPLVYTMLDPAHGALTGASAPGAGTLSALRGAARVEVALPTGAARDTAFITVLPRPGAIALTSGGSQSATAGTALGGPVLVRLTATDGQPLGGAAMAVAVTTGGGIVTPVGTVTDSTGAFQFDWQLGPTAGTQTATVTSPGVTPLVVSANAISTGAVRLRITQQIGPTHQAGDSLPALLIEARNALDELDALYGDSVFLSFAVNPAGGTLLGTIRVRAVAGVARFDNFRVQRAGTGYRLLATAPALLADTSAAFAITARNASILALQSGGNQTAAPGTALPQPVVVRVTDAFSNPIAGVPVTFAVAAGSVSAATVNSDALGLASVTWTLGPAAGAQSLTVASAGLTGSPMTVLANDAGGAIATTTVAPAFDTLTAIGAARTLVATSRDAASTVVPGSYTWVSRAPGVATVDGSGRVVAVAGGTTYVVATEAGGTRDSSRIVVDQRLATINVTPATRNVYLTGSVTFTASAVDGLGVPLVVQPTIAWSTASSAIATVTPAGGVATGVGLGTTQVRATAGAVTGVATLNVLSPIIRIAVVRDSTGFVTTDTFSLAAITLSRSYRAVAHDTLDAVIPGITFTWASSNPSVAVLDSIGGETARARAAANGFTAVRATAQGVTGAAALTVAQVPAGIAITPTAATVAVGGSTVLTPRRRDSQGVFIPGGTFTFASADPTVATVTPAGVVTGVRIASTYIRASSGALVDSALVTVDVPASVPPIISFGRDTLAIGRSAVNVPVPIYLSRPAGSAVTVNLAVADTFAFFNPTSVSIAAGQTVGTAQISGRNAGTTQVFAVDGSGTGYAGDTAVLAVQATVRLNTTSYAMMVNDERPAQVQLTDPAPAGGTFITFTEGTPGRVSVSPDPAFIPAGQLSVNIVIRGLTAGTTTLTPVATGVNGVGSTVTTAAAVLQTQPGSMRLGAGQSYVNAYPYVTYAVTNAIPVTLVSSDTTVVRVPATVVIPGGSYYVYYNVTALTPGSATITASSPGWTGFTIPVTVTTPNVGVAGGGTYNTTQPATGVTVYSRDSTGTVQYRTSALNVQLSSSDTSVLRVLTPTVTIPAGQYYTSSGQVIAGGNPGTARLYATASGHTGDSTAYTFVGPRLQFSWTANRIGAGQEDYNLYVYTPNNVTAPLTVSIANSDSSIVGLPTSVTIPANTYYTYFNVRGKVPGVATFVATAPGFSPDTATYTVTSPRLSLSGGGTVNAYSPAGALTTYAADSVGTVHYRTDSLVVTYVSTDTSVLRVTAADTIRPGQYYTNLARVSFVGTGTARIVATAPGHAPDSVSYTVQTPRLQFTFTTQRIGRRQYRQSSGEQYVYVPNATGSPIPVTITQTNPAADSLSSTSLTIPGNLYYAYFGYAGLQTGVDTLIASAPGYLPDTAVIIVTSPRFTGGTLPGTATTTSPPATVTLYVADSVGTAHYSLDTILVAARTSDPAVLQPDSVGFLILPGAYYRNTRVLYTGPGTASMTYVDSLGTGYPPITSNAVTVTGPALFLHNGRPTLGMRQNGALSSSYVQIPNAIGSPLVVNLVSSDPTVATVPATVTIPAGQTYAYFQISAQDVIGTVQIQASATGYSATTVNQQVTAPRFTVSAPSSMNTTSAPGTITVYATDAAGTAHYVNENVTVTLASSSGAVGTIDSATVVIPAGGYFNNAARFTPVASGTVQVSATDTRIESYRYDAGTANVSVVTPTLSLGWGGAQVIGIGQWMDQYVAVPDYRTTPLTVNLAHLTSASSTPASVVIPNSTYYIYFRLTGASAGTDSIAFTAAGHNGITGAVSVGQGRVDGIGGWPGTLNTDSVAVTLYARDPGGTIRNVSAATTFNLAISSGALEARVGGATVASVTIPADASSVTFYLRRLANGSATVTFTNANYATHVSPAVTVTGAP